MKIMIANYRFFISGGPERYMFNSIDALKKINHVIIPFSIDYNINKKNSYQKYFPSPLCHTNAVYFHDHKFSFRTLLKTISRLFYSTEAKSCADRIISDTKPDVAYVLNYLRKLSPSLLVALKSNNIPIIVRISDFSMLCPQGHCFRDGSPCELCLSGNICHSIFNKCVHNSYIASFLNAIATIYHRKKRFFDLIDHFVVTNPFIYKLMINAGYPSHRIKIIPTFVDSFFFKPIETSRSHVRTFIYSGRLEFTKGVHVVLRAFGNLKLINPDLHFQLLIAGSGSPKYINFLNKICSDYEIDNSVRFLGQLNKKELAFSLNSAQIGIVPSLWYENLPNALLECFASGLPVIASDIGSLSYCIENNINGILFPAGDHEKLCEILQFCMQNPETVSFMSQQARKIALKKFSKLDHISKLTKLFSEIISRKNL